MKGYLFAFALFAGLFGFKANARDIPIQDFFRDPGFTSVSLSPSGEYITVSVPQEDRTVLAAFRASDMELVGKWDYGAQRHIDRVRWVNDKRFFMYVTRKLGRYDFRVGTPDVYASNVDGTGRKDIPNGGYFQIVDTLDDEPDRILVSRSIDSAYLFKMDVDDGQTINVASSPLDSGSFLVDHNHQLRYAVGQSNENQSIVLRREGKGWKEVHRSELGEASRRPIGFAADNKRVIFAVSERGESSKLVLLDPETGTETLISSNPNVQPNDWILSSDGKELLAVEYLDGLPHYDFVNKTHEESKLYAGLIKAFPEHAVTFHGISNDGNFVLLRKFSDVDPGAFYLYDRRKGAAKFLLASRDWIKPEEMSPMRPIVVTARDGTKLHGYLTIPRGTSGKDLPLVFHPHGGPHGPRDEWGFNPDVQFLANRGYAVLQINFRGSGGYGSAFERKGYRNWGTTMIDDMTDAVRWTVQQGIVAKDRICTYGASYGGYAALQTVVREPAMYQCAIGYVGVYSLPLMFQDGDIPEREPGRNFLRRILPETLAEQQAQSAAYNVDMINIPVMLVQGAKDERVPISQYKLLIERLSEAGKPPEQTLIAEKEGHGFYKLENNVKLYTMIEAFLGKHIGGGREATSARASN